MLTKERVFEIMGPFYGNDHYRAAIAQNTPEEELAVITEILDRVNALGYRVCNLHALENVEDIRLAPLILEAYDRLTTDNRRAGAIGILRKRCYAPFVPELITRYEKADSAFLRRTITDALFGIGSRKYIPEYLRLVQAEGYGESSDYLLDLLCKLRVREAVPSLLKLHEKNPHDWHWTLLKYGPMTRAAELIPAIRPYLECDDGELRRLTRKALEKLEE